MKKPSDFLDRSYSEMQQIKTKVCPNVLPLSMNNEFGVDTAFKVKDNFGRTLYLKNLMSNVIILQLNSDRESAFAFRNTPSFYGDNPDLKDALYETDAGLDHYFYHHNTGKEGKGH